MTDSYTHEGRVTDTCHFYKPRAVVLLISNGLILVDHSPYIAGLSKSHLTEKQSQPMTFYWREQHRVISRGPYYFKRCYLPWKSLLLLCLVIPSFYGCPGQPGTLSYVITSMQLNDTYGLTGRKQSMRFRSLMLYLGRQIICTWATEAVTLMSVLAPISSHQVITPIRDHMYVFKFGEHSTV